MEPTVLIFWCGAVAGLLLAVLVAIVSRPDKRRYIVSVARYNLRGDSPQLRSVTVKARGFEDAAHKASPESYELFGMERVTRVSRC